MNILLDEWNKKGVKNEIYNPQKLKKKEEEILSHGVQKIEEMTIKKFGFKKNFEIFYNFYNDYRKNNPMQFYLFIYMNLILIILLMIILKLNSLNCKYENIFLIQNRNIENLLSFINKNDGNRNITNINN